MSFRKVFKENEKSYPTSLPTNVDYNSVKLINAVNIVYLKKKKNTGEKKNVLLQIQLTGMFKL